MGVTMHQSSSRISAAFWFSLVYIDIGTHAPATYSEITANTIAVSCTVSVHALTVLSDSLSKHYLPSSH